MEEIPASSWMASRSGPIGIAGKTLSPSCGESVASAWSRLAVDVANTKVDPFPTAFEASVPDWSTPRLSPQIDAVWNAQYLDVVMSAVKDPS